MRLVLKAHNEDQAYYRKFPNSEKRPLLSRDLDVALLQSNRKLSLTLERVIDDDLRQQTGAFRSRLNHAVMLGSREQFDRIAAANEFGQTNSKLGAALRGYIRGD
jgi:hypothetical protein